MKVLLLYRAKEFSPNNVEKDAALLKSVGFELENRGHSAVHIQEEDFLYEPTEGIGAIVSMGRRYSTLMALEQKQGIKVVNSPMAVRYALKRSMTLGLLQIVKVPVPAFWVYDARKGDTSLCKLNLRHLFPGWIKGMSNDGVSSSDVQYVSDPATADIRLNEMLAEGYDEIVVTEHLPGFVVKAYCVDGKLIHWMIPQLSGYTKFGDEVHNDEPHPEWVDEEALSRYAEIIGKTIHLKFFGFDAIVSGPGEIKIIDVNDAPSFSSCREKAASMIADLIN